MFGSVLVACLVLLEFEHLDLVFGKQRFRYGQHDALFVVRCEAGCWHHRNRNPCVKACLAKDASKPGSCPKDVSTLSRFETVCMDTCRQDTKCPALTKCCRHGCGVTCQPPEDLASVTGLPDIPTDVSVTEGRRKRSIVIKWKVGDVPADEGVLYVVEERHYTGRNFVPSRMSEWSTCVRSTKPSQVLRHFAKPGRWYQFRVAAVNANWTKGFSEPSVGYTIPTGPRPPKEPQNVTVGPLWMYNGLLSAEVRWVPPPSDLPIQRYKVFCSRRLQGAATVLDSVLVHQHTVAKDETKFVLHDLQPNSLYFIQVQALVQFGKERIKGEKSGLVLNTTNYTNLTNREAAENQSQGSVEDLMLQRLFWSKGELRAKVVWKSKRKPLRYTVTWWSGPCRNAIDEYNNIRLAATTKASYFDLYDLQFDCRYRVSIREVAPDGTKSLEDTSITFKTPPCNEFKLRYKCRNTLI